MKIFNGGVEGGNPKESLLAKHRSRRMFSYFSVTAIPVERESKLYSVYSFRRKIMRRLFKQATTGKTK